MRILQICSKPSLPLVDGGCLASFQLSQNILSAGFELKVMSLSTEKHPFLPDKIDPTYSKNVGFKAVSADTRLNAKSVIFNLLEKKSIQEHRFFSKSFEQEILKELSENTYDIIIFDGLMTGVYLNSIKSQTKAKLVYRSHNIEFQLFDQKKSSTKNSVKRLYLDIQSKRIKNFESYIWNAVHTILSISQKDIEVMELSVSDTSKIFHHPFSIELSNKDWEFQKNTVFHLGSMNWQPNISGVKWFIKSVWPKVIEKNEKCELHLGGKDIGKQKQRLSGQGITVHEKVEDAETFASSYDILVIPLFEGSGIRIKALEAMARGNVIVSTSKGVEGIPVKNGVNVLIADKADAFAEAIISLINDEALKMRLRVEAKTLIYDNYRSEVLSEKLKIHLTQT